MRRQLAALCLAGAGLTVGGPGMTFAAPTHASITGSQVVQVAMQYLGRPYKANDGNPMTGFSPLGFVRYVYLATGMTLPNNLKRLYQSAPKVDGSQLQPGDLVFFKNTIRPGLSHVGIYVGNGTFIHSEYYGTGVVVTSFTGDPRDSNYWAGKYAGAIRPLASNSY